LKYCPKKDWLGKAKGRGADLPDGEGGLEEEGGEPLVGGFEDGGKVFGGEAEKGGIEAYFTGLAVVK
jgi:hypothetical protein